LNNIQGDLPTANHFKCDFFTVVQRLRRFQLIKCRIVPWQ